MPKRGWLTASVMLTIVSLVASGCTGHNEQHSIAVGPASNAEATVDGITVNVPPDAVDSAGTLTVAAVDPADADLPDPSFVPVAGVQVNLSGARLTGTATITFTAPNDTDGDPLVVLWSDGNGRWEPRPTTAGPDGTVSARTDHFSPGWLVRIDVKRWASDRIEEFRNLVISRSDVQQPTCGDEEGPRAAGVRVTSDSGDSVKWCYGVEEGRSVVKVANNRRTFTTITYPRSWKVKNGSSISLSENTIARFFGDTFATTGKRAARTIDGGSTLTLLPPDGAAGRVVAQADFPAWAFGAIMFGLDVSSGMATKLGADQASGTADRFIGLVTGGGDAGYFQALQACTRSAANNSDNDGNSPTSFDAASKAVQFLWQCLPSYMTADLKEAGFAIFGAGAVLRVIEGAASAVLTAAHLLLTASREIYDNFASLGGESSATYAITIRQPTAAEPAPSPTSVTPDAGPVTPTASPDVRPTTGGFAVGSGGTYKCIVAWPFAPERSSNAVSFRSTCSGQPRSILFVDITVPDPNYTPPGSRPFLIDGTMVDKVTSDMGFTTLLLLANETPRTSS